jgi:hypothetical protein
MCAEQIIILSCYGICYSYVSSCSFSFNKNNLSKLVELNRDNMSKLNSVKMSWYATEAGICESVHSEYN